MGPQINNLTLEYRNEISTSNLTLEYINNNFNNITHIIKDNGNRGYYIIWGHNYYLHNKYKLKNNNTSYYFLTLKTLEKYYTMNYNLLNTRKNWYNQNLRKRKLITLEIKTMINTEYENFTEYMNRNPKYKLTENPFGATNYNI